MTFDTNENDLRREHAPGKCKDIVWALRANDR
jgi:hypothetical protein